MSRRMLPQPVNVLMMLLCLCPPALAQDVAGTQQAADSFFERGKELLARDDWAGACSNFERSQQLDPSASTLVKLARCHEHAGRPGSAWHFYVEAEGLLAQKPRSDKHAQALAALVESAKQSLAPRVARLVVTLSPTPDRATLFLDDHPTSQAAAAAGLVVDPGAHTLRMDAEGFSLLPVSITLDEGASQALELHPIRQSPAPVAAPPPAKAVSLVYRKTATAAPTPPPTPVDRPSNPALSSTRVAAIVAASTGTVLVGLAGYFEYKARSLVDDARSNDHCDSDFNCDAFGMKKLRDAGDEQTRALALVGGGALLLGTGVVLYLTEPAKETPLGSRSMHLSLKASVSELLLDGTY